MLTDLVVFESLMQEVVRVLEHSLDGCLTQPGVRVQLRPPTEHKLLKRRRLALAVTESDCWPGRQHRNAVQLLNVLYREDGNSKQTNNNAVRT